MHCYAVDDAFGLLSADNMNVYSGVLFALSLVYCSFLFCYIDRIYLCNLTSRKVSPIVRPRFYTDSFVKQNKIKNSMAPGTGKLFLTLTLLLPVADRDGPLWQNFFIFMQFSGKISQIVCWRPPLANPGSAIDYLWIYGCHRFLVQTLEETPRWGFKRIKTIRIESMHDGQKFKSGHAQYGGSVLPEEFHFLYT